MTMTGEDFPTDGDTTPYGMPEDIYRKIQPIGASVERAQWVLDNRPDVALSELAHDMALQPEEIEQLVFRPRDPETPTGQ
jgi:hypothetical protein